MFFFCVLYCAIKLAVQCSTCTVWYLILYRFMPNTHRRRRRDKTVESRRVCGVYTNSQLFGDSFVVSSVWTHPSAVVTHTAALCVRIAESVGSRREFMYMYTPPTPTRRDKTVSSRRRRRCVLGFRHRFDGCKLPCFECFLWENVTVFHPGTGMPLTHSRAMTTTVTYPWFCWWRHLAFVAVFFPVLLFSTSSPLLILFQDVSYLSESLLSSCVQNTSVFLHFLKNCGIWHFVDPADLSHSPPDPYFKSF